MGCSSSKQEAAVNNNSNTPRQKNEPTVRSSSAKPSDRLYKILFKAKDCKNLEDLSGVYAKSLKQLEQPDKAVARYRNPTTKATCLHLAAKLMDQDCSKQLLSIIEQLCQAFPQAASLTDSAGNIPLHYAVAPSVSSGRKMNWQSRAFLVSKLIQTDPVTAQHFLKRNNVVFDADNSTGACSPLYRVLQTLGDDYSQNAPSVNYVHVIHRGAGVTEMPGVGNASDGDKPLSLLYRRFSRQFDISEKFFAGDNSRPEVLEHRQKYKTAAGNTWKSIEVLLRPPPSQAEITTHQQQQPWGIVHRAVQVETPPDLLRYIVETNAQDLTKVDDEGNLPLHYAARNKPPNHVIQNTNFPVFYNKYVVDELLYKFPEGATMKDARGNFPLTLAVRANKQWIGGGIKSLHDAFPEAISQINLESHETLKRALSLLSHEISDGEEDDDHVEKEEKQGSRPGIIKDHHHDAIMLVQQSDVDVSEVVTSMWAHEEDAGVQMLGCVAIYKMLVKCRNNQIEILRIALSAVAAVVNAMKAHPNEMIVQETACKALRYLAPADGRREVSMVASGAVAAIVGAMQAHVGDVGVQREACSAIAAIVHTGGSDRATIVASVSGLTAILNALSAHPNTESVQTTGLQALVSMTNFGKEANLPDLPRSHTEPILISAKQIFPKECGRMADVLSDRMSV